MLFEIGFQSACLIHAERSGCDLMLFEIGFQWRGNKFADLWVVI